MSSFQKLEITEVKKALLEISGGIIEQITNKIQQTKKIDPNYSDLDLSEIKIGKFFIDINIMLNKHPSLQLLYLVDCSLSSLQGFSIPSLIGIDLSRNHISDNSHIEALLNCKKLQQIIIVDNKIQKLQTLLKLEALENLYEIDFSKNPVLNEKESTSTIFQKYSSHQQRFQNIKYVNGKDKQGVQAPLQNEQEYQSENSYEEDYQDQQQDLNDNDNSSQNEDAEENQKKGKKKK